MKRFLIFLDSLLFIYFVFRHGKTIPIEPSGDPLTCPVRVIDSYLMLDEGENREALLFPTVKGTPLKTASVSAIVKRVAMNAGLEGRFSGHSLRIGGATAALQGGMTMEHIRSIGDWESKAILFYLRSVGAANIGASTKMGL